MTIANNYTPIRQLGNGTTTQFSANWSMLLATYAQVNLEDSVSHVQTPVTQGSGPTQYQIAITSSGFTITFGTAPLSTQYVNVSRKTPVNQTNSYKTSQGFQGAVEEDSFDKLTAMIQEIDNAGSRAIVVPLGDTSDTELPSSTVRANTFLAFDSSGNVIVAQGASAGTPISTAMIPVVQASSPAAAGVSTTGDGKITIKNVADDGWVLMDDGTIGSAASMASNRANADTVNLYALLWNNITNTYAPVTGGRGANAAADFAANKPMALTKQLGRAIAVAGTGAGLTARVLGSTVGDENLQTHQHPITDKTHHHTVPTSPTGFTASGSGANFATSNSTTTSDELTGITNTDNFGTGSGGNMQPTSFWNVMIKL